MLVGCSCFFERIRKKNIRNEVVPVLVLLETAKGHLGAGDELLGVLEVVEEGVLVPLDTLLLVGVGVGEALDGAGLAAKKTVESGADLVAAAGLEGVALRAAGLEEVGTLLGITYSMAALVNLDMLVIVKTLSGCSSRRVVVSWGAMGFATAKRENAAGAAAGSRPGRAVRDREV